MIYSLREFIENIIIESLHPELQAIVTQKTNPYGTSKQAQLAKKIKDLTSAYWSTTHCSQRSWIL